ncbi:MAG: hypothetical protein KAI64_03865, partial [Thermoplasmata archaeon]|nr:hypothetical protein [Thermoplasmata archaeon]
MNIDVKTVRVEEEAGELAAIMCFKADNIPRKPSSLKRIDRALNGTISSIFKDKEFSGKKGQVTLLHTFHHLKAKRIMLIGLGERKKFNVNILRTVSGKAVAKANEMEIKEIAFELPEEILNVPVDRQVEALATGAELSVYQFKKYIKEKDEKPAIKNTVLI